jgi:adenylosuccinate synthase
MVVPNAGQFGARNVEYTEDEIVHNAMQQGKLLRRYLKDVSTEVVTMLEQGKNVMFQGSQGIMLDIDWGNYPKVTSSNPTPNAIPVAVGVPLIHIAHMENVGVMKAYLTKVGSGPVATCLDNHQWPVDETMSTQEAMHIRKKGQEFGATTKRARRVGWLDLVQLSYACRMSALTQLAMTKLDVLEGLDEIKVAHAYLLPNGQQTTEYRAWDLQWLNSVEPLYVTMPGFKEGEVSCAKQYEDLPESARNLITLVEQYTKVPVTIISTGPKASQTIFRNKYPFFKFITFIKF